MENIKSKDKGYIENYFSEMETIIKDISRDDVEKVIEVLFKAWENSNQVFIIGNGGSASTATHLACDLSKGTIVERKKRFRVKALTDNIPLVSAWTNDAGFENIFYEQLKDLIKKDDVVIGISVHGGSGQDRARLWSQNLLKALEYAKKCLAVTIGFSGFDGGAMKKMVDACIVIPFNSTPHVESFHLALAHLICNCLKERIKRF